MRAWTPDRVAAGTGLDDRDRRARVLADHPGPRRRNGRIQGYVGTARLENPQAGHGQAWGAIEADRDQNIGSDAERAQLVGELIRPAIELCVAQRFVLEHHGGRIRRALDLLLEEYVDRIRFEGSRALAPVRQQTLTLGGREDRYVQDRALGIGGNLLQQGSEVPEHAHDAILVEEIGVVLGQDPQAPVPGPGRRRPIARRRVAAVPGQRPPHRGDVLTSAASQSPLDGRDRPRRHRVLGRDRRRSGVRGHRVRPPARPRPGDRGAAMGVRDRLRDRRVVALRFGRAGLRGGPRRCRPRGAGRGWIQGVDLRGGIRDPGLAGRPRGPPPDRILRPAALRPRREEQGPASGASRPRARSTPPAPWPTGSPTWRAATGSCVRSASKTAPRSSPSLRGATPGPRRRIVGHPGVLRHVRERRSRRGPRGEEDRLELPARAPPVPLLLLGRPRRGQDGAGRPRPHGPRPGHAETGRAVWTFATRPGSTRLRRSPGDRVYVGSGDGRLYVLDLRTGTLVEDFDSASAFRGVPGHCRRPSRDRRPSTASCTASAAGLKRPPSGLSRPCQKMSPARPSGPPSPRLRARVLAHNTGQPSGFMKAQGERPWPLPVATPPWPHVALLGSRVRGRPCRSPPTGPAGGEPTATASRPRPACCRSGAPGGRPWRGRPRESAPGTRASPWSATASTRWATRTERSASLHWARDGWPGPLAGEAGADLRRQERGRAAGHARLSTRGACSRIGTEGDLLCLDADTGKEIWRKSLPRDFGGKMMSRWKWSESPLVDGDRLVFTPGARDAALVTVEKATGREIWRAATPRSRLRGQGRRRLLEHRRLATARA